MLYAWKASGDRDMSDSRSCKPGNSSSHVALTGDGEEITLASSDIPGADLVEPFEKHNSQALRWWLLCRGMKVPQSVKKADLVAKYVYFFC